MNNVDRLLFKLKNLVYFDTLFSLEEDFNSVGLSVQMSGNNRVILCQITEGRASAHKVLEDYIFLGPFTMATNKAEISERLQSSIMDFVMNKSGNPAKIENAPRLWQQGVKTYGQVIRIMNEDVQLVSQDMI